MMYNTDYVSLVNIEYLTINITRELTTREPKQKKFNTKKQVNAHF